MPGPSNSKKKRKQQAGKEKSRKMKNLLQEVLNTREAEQKDSVDQHIEHKHSHSVEPIQERSNPSQTPTNLNSEHYQGSPIQLQRPFIHDPGNGPRVIDMAAYLSSFFVSPPAMDDLLCAAFMNNAGDALAMLEGVLGLPREVALIVWYNKTRKLGRVCPACQRLYRLGDTLSDPITNQLLDPREPSTPSWVLREQYISGLCSAPCFTLASYTSHPFVAHVVRGAWGRLADEIDDETAAILAAPRASTIVNDGSGATTAATDDQGLGTVLRVTRLIDLGLGEVVGIYAFDGHRQVTESEPHETRTSDTAEEVRPLGDLRPGERYDCRPLEWERTEVGGQLVC